MLAPETLLAKVLGMLVQAVALNAGMLPFVLGLAGEAVEQAVSPAFQPGRPRARC